MTPDPITTAQEAVLELRQIACLLNDDQAQTGANFDRETAITAALDYAERLTRDVRDLQDLAKIRNEQHAAELEKLKAERDEARLSWKQGEAVAWTNEFQLSQMKDSDTLHFVWPIQKKPTDIPLFTYQPDQSAEIIRLTSQLEQVERVIAPFAAASAIIRSYNDADVMPAGPIKVANIRAASQWIKDRQAKGEG